MANSLVIKNGLIVNEGSITEGDLAIDDERIAQVGGIASGTNEIDVNGAWVIPGMIDDQVHFREPGLEHKGEIRTESKAAVAGGITSYMEMPNCIPQTISQDRLLAKIERATHVSHANFGFYLGATNDNLEAIKSVDTSLACGVKVFMGASTGNMLVDDEATLHGIFESSPLLIATHCEDTPTIEANERVALEEFGEDMPASQHPLIRSREACLKSSTLAVSLAKEHGSRLHVLHLTTADEMALFDPGPIAAKRITAEVCAHHLFFNDAWYESKGAYIKCNPAIKRRSDQLALRKALVEDRIDVIATDHAPHTIDEKQQPFALAPAGLPLVQHALLSLFEQAIEGIFDVTTLVHKTSHAPAELYQVAERGYLREGYFADVVVVDSARSTAIDEEPILAKCGWSPFAGITFASRITHTFVNGHLVYEESGVASEPQGQRLTYARAS
ncbi:MAG: dihydroorotase [Gammaproteobacteria bacterium]|nr:dihydroorotase [Gammaproteobacteria bacterium]